MIDTGPWKVPDSGSEASVMTATIDPGPKDRCPDCGELCDDAFYFCWCTSACTVCDDAYGVDLALEQFTFTIPTNSLAPGDYQDCHHDGGAGHANTNSLMAFWEGDQIIVADTQSDYRWHVIRCEAQNRPASRQYYTWYCERIGVADPCDEDFMKAISS